MFVDRAGIEGVDWSDGDVGRYGFNGGVMPAAVVRNNDISRQAHGIACRNVIAIGRAFRGGKADGRVSRRKPSGGGVYSFLRNMPFSLVPFPDKRAILGLMVAAVIIAALAYANRGLIRMYIKVKWNPGHRNPR